MRNIILSGLTQNRPGQAFFRKQYILVRLVKKRRLGNFAQVLIL